MSWYDEKRDGSDKRYIEWMMFPDEIEPAPNEPGFYIVKGRRIAFDFSKEAKEAWRRVFQKREAEA